MKSFFVLQIKDIFYCFIYIKVQNLNILGDRTIAYIYKILILKKYAYELVSIIIKIY